MSELGSFIFGAKFIQVLGPMIPFIQTSKFCYILPSSHRLRRPFHIFGVATARGPSMRGCAASPTYRSRPRRGRTCTWVRSQPGPQGSRRIHSLPNTRPSRKHEGNGPIEERETGVMKVEFKFGIIQAVSRLLSQLCLYLSPM